MAVTLFVTAIATAAVITMLIHSGAAKLVAPAATAGAVSELVSGRWSVPVGLVRGFAASELIMSVGLLVPGLRVLASVLIAGLGGVFAVAGVWGRLRGSAEPCGCFGSAGSKPLGATNVAVGIVLIVFGLASALLAPPPDVLIATGLLAVVGAAGLAVLRSGAGLRRLLRRSLATRNS